MASGGNKTKSVIKLSDKMRDTSCMPCSKDGKKVDGVQFCLDCKSYFCKSCLRDHNKFPALKSHKVVTKSEMKAMEAMKARSQNGPTAEESLPTDTCTEHPDNVIQMYCGDHEALCCTVCVAVDHRLCKGVVFIPTVARGILRSPERNRSRTSLDKIRRELEQIKIEKAKELSEVNRRRTEILKEIENFKKRILERIDKLEKVSIEKVQAKHKEIVNQINVDINSIDHMIKSIGTQLKNTDKFKGNNEAQFFVNIKSNEKVEAMCADFIGHIENIDLEMIPFELNHDIESFLNDIDSFGAMVDVLQTGEYDVTTKNNKTAANIQDVCVLESGQLVVTDYRNDEVKRLNKSYRVFDTCELPGGPFSLCEIGPKEIAVSLFSRERVQFVKLGKNMTLSKSFSVEKRCRGVCFSQGELYFACGGGYNEGVGHIKVYNLNGLLLRTLQNDKTGLAFSRPIQLVPSLDGMSIYVADKENGLHIIDRLGHCVSLVNDPRLDGIVSVCVSNHGQLYVCGINSQNVVKLDRNGHFDTEVLKKSDGINYPQCVRYHQKTKELLVVCQNSGKIKTFKAK